MTRFAVAAATAVVVSAAAAAPSPVRISGDPLAVDVPGAHATAVEPSAAAIGSTIVTAFQVGRRFGGGASAIGFATSVDAGRTWSAGLLPGLTQFSPGPPGEAPQASDPVVAFDAQHDRWLIATLSGSGGRNVIFVSRSTDGVRWDAPLIARSAPPFSLDKEWLTCDNARQSPMRGHCYLAYSDFVFHGASVEMRLAVQSSVDGGSTWTAPVLLPIDYDVDTDTLSAEPVTRPNGELVIVFFERDHVKAVRSGDGGATFGTRETVATLSQRSYSFAPDHLRATPVPSVAVDAAGTVYAAWYDCRFRTSCAGNDIAVARSTEPGTWTQPERLDVPAPQAGADFVLPALAVDPATQGAGAHLALAYYTLSTHDCAEPTCGLVATFATSTTGGRRWEGSPVGDAMQLDWLAPTSIGRMVGDYVAAVFVPGRAVGIFALANPPRDGRLDESIAAAVVPLAQPAATLLPPRVRGRSALIRWRGNDPAATFDVAIRANGASWRLVRSRTTATSMTYVGPRGTRIAVRVRAVDASGETGPWTRPRTAVLR